MKKTQKIQSNEFRQTITYVLGCNTIRWTQIASYVSKQAKRCRLCRSFENLRREMHFLDIIFQQDNAPVHKLKVIGIFFQENEWKVLEWPAYSPNLNPIEKLWAILKQQLRKQTVFWKNLEEKVYEMWNEIDADVVRNLYENYANRLLDIKNAKGVMTRF